MAKVPCKIRAALSPEQRENLTNLNNFLRSTLLLCLHILASAYRDEEKLLRRVPQNKCNPEKKYFAFCGCFSESVIMNAASKIGP
ncbi:hypothetical protein [Pantoea alhagi]|uniref:hypothetical protein n=1 Tax=Pantoea alhagi TaxID=1891675 RepID=UPI0012F4A036|nr:hypothetical protein [Pantoea alhagi]